MVVIENVVVFVATVSVNMVVVEVVGSVVNAVVGAWHKTDYNAIPITHHSLLLL